MSTPLELESPTDILFLPTSPDLKQADWGGGGTEGIH